MVDVEARVSALEATVSSLKLQVVKSVKIARYLTKMAYYFQTPQSKVYPTIDITAVHAELVKDLNKIDINENEDDLLVSVQWDMMSFQSFMRPALAALEQVAPVQAALEQAGTNAALERARALAALERAGAPKQAGGALENMNKKSNPQKTR